MKITFENKKGKKVVWNPGKMFRNIGKFVLGLAICYFFFAAMGHLTLTDLYINNPDNPTINDMVDEYRFGDLIRN